MTQQRVQLTCGRNIKKLLVQLASRELNWREQKTKQIATSQRYGLNVSSSLKIDFPKNHKERPIVKSTNYSVQHIHKRGQFRLKKQQIKSTDLDNNGNAIQSKRSIIHKSKNKISSFGRNRTAQDENQSPKNQKQNLLPKLDKDLKKKTSLEFLKLNILELNNEYLQIIEQQDPRVLKKAIKTAKFEQKDIY